MKKILISALLLFPILFFGQTKFTSSKYNYSFTYPDGWHKKDKIYNPDVDAKIVDGKGNSFIVTVMTRPAEDRNATVEDMKSLKNSEIKQQLDAIYGNSEIIRRGIVYIGYKPFYYTHFYVPFQNGLRLYHKMYFYLEDDKTLIIDACSIETYVNQTTPSFAIMMDTFRISNLNIK